MKKILILIAIATTISCASQKTSQLVLKGALQSSEPFKTSISNANLTKYVNTITASDLKTYLYIIASDSMEGRDTGSKGQKKAGEYLINQYKSNTISFPKGATDYYQRIPAAFLNAKRNIICQIQKISGHTSKVPKNQTKSS